MGPIEVVVISFPDPGLMSGIAPLLEQLTQGGTLNIVDAVIAMREPDGTVTVTDLEDEILPRWSAISPDQRPLLSSTDAELVVEELGQNAAALLLAIEHSWADAIAQVAADAGGTLELHVRVDPDTVEAAALVDS
jgi:hypothetical protein